MSVNQCINIVSEIVHDPEQLEALHDVRSKFIEEVRTQGLSNKDTQDSEFDY